MHRTDHRQPVAQPSEDQEDGTEGHGGGARPKIPEASASARGNGTWRASENNASPTARDIFKYLDEWRTVLRIPKVRKALLDDLDPSEIVFQLTYMPTVDEQQITARQKNSGRTAAVDLFLDILARLGNQSWPRDLVRILGEINQGHLADILELEYRRVTGQTAPPNRVREPRRNPLTEPRIPTRHLDALLQYGDVWKATIRHERKILRENVDPTEVTVYFPYLSNRVDEKVRAIQASQGRTRAMDVFIDDGLLYIGDQNWPNDLCYALGRVNQSFVAEQLKHKFLELLKKQEDTKYRKLAHYIRNEKPDWSTNFGVVLSTERRK